MGVGNVGLPTSVNTRDGVLGIVDELYMVLCRRLFFLLGHRCAGVRNYLLPEVQTAPAKAGGLYGHGLGIISHIPVCYAFTRAVLYYLGRLNNWMAHRVCIRKEFKTAILRIVVCSGVLSDNSSFDHGTAILSNALHAKRKSGRSLHNW